MDIQMTDGLNMQCYPVGMWLEAPRKLEGKIYGLAGSQHWQNFFNHGGRGNPHSRKSGNPPATLEWAAGINKKNLAFMNQELGPEKLSSKKVSGNKGSADQVSEYDLKPSVAGEPMPGMVHPQDGISQGNCRQNYQYGYRQSAYNGNRPWKGIAKMFVSWRVDDDEIPTVFGQVSAKRKASNTRWHELTPAFGVSQNAPNGAKALAKKACASLLNFAQKYKDCIFDFMASGKDGTKKNVAGAREESAGDPKKAKSYSVRDASGNGGMGRWVSRPSWGCVDEFAAQLTKAAKQHFAAKHRATQTNAMCKCKHEYLGVCSYDHFICIAEIDLDSDQMNYKDQ